MKTKVISVESGVNNEVRTARGDHAASGSITFARRSGVNAALCVLSINHTFTDKLNAKVYADFFLTPDSDPWLGLVPPDTFTGLENNGLAQISERKFNTSTPTKTGP